MSSTNLYFDFNDFHPSYDCSIIFTGDKTKLDGGPIYSDFLLDTQNSCLLFIALLIVYLPVLNQLFKLRKH